MGGLADIKAARIRAILDTLVQERGACCLEHLRALSDAEVKLHLTRHAPSAHGIAARSPSSLCQGHAVLLSSSGQPL